MKTQDPIEQKQRKKRRRRIILISIVVLLVGFRLALPYIVLRYVNRTLAGIEQYEGHVEDIDIALIRGAYVIRGIRIDKKDAEDTIPFFTCPEIDLSVEWKAIFKGRIVGEISVESPRLNFVKENHRGEDVKQDTADFRDVIKDLMPLTINRFEINNGQIHYIDPGSKPLIDVALRQLHATASNLSNVNDSSTALPARLEATGQAYKGNFALNINLNMLEKEPTFDLDLNVRGVDMTMLNDFFRAYGNFDVRRGTFGLYTECAARNGNFKGYVKPILKDLDIVQFTREEGNPAQVLWESVIGTIAEIFQNQRKEQLATKIPLEGKFDRPNASLWNAGLYVLKNAFVSALKPSIDHSIDIGQVPEQDDKKGLFGKVFGKKSKKKKR